MSENTTCDKCNEIAQTEYQFCPVCGHNLTHAKVNELGHDVLRSDLKGSKKMVINQLITKLLGISLLLIGSILLIWFCWSSYVGYFIKFNKPIPDKVFSIDSEFFNLANDNRLYNTFLIVFILFGLIKVGFWLLKHKKK